MLEKSITMMEYIDQYTIGDNLESLKKIPDQSLTLVYFDPPYNTGRNFHDFDDRFKSIKSYVDFMTERIAECHRVIRPGGHIVIHIEPRISHYFRVVCDEIFGMNNFKNEIVWKTGGNAKNKYQLNRFHDTIIVYSKKVKSTDKLVFNPIHFAYDDDYRKKSNVKMCDHHKKEFVTTASHNAQPNVNPRPNLRYSFNGHEKQWYVTQEKMHVLHDDNRLVYNGNGVPRIKRFLDEMDGIPLRDIWCDISNTQSGEKVDYATQKPVKLLERIVELYSNPDDVCMDIFAGSGTLGIASVNLDRKYILLDINQHGKDMFEQRLEKIQVTELK